MQPMLTRSRLAELSRAKGPWVTILTPLNGGGPLAKGDPARYRNLVRAVEDQLETRANGDGHTMVERLRAVADDREVFSAGAPGMVVFANPDGVKLWHLPEAVSESAVVDERPHLEQLLPIVSQPSHFYVVALGLHGTRLFSCDRYEARPMPLPSGTPARLEDAAGWEIEEEHLQYHNMRSGPGGPPGHQGNRPIFHGQGGGVDDRDQDIEKYLRAIDHALFRAIPHREAPVVLACDPQVEGIFRRITRLPNVIEPAVHGSFERKGAEILHEHAWPLVAPRVAERVWEARQRFLDLHGTGRTAEHIEDVVRFASEGRVEILFVREGTSISGVFDEARWEVQLGDGQGSTDLVDRAASDTFLDRGTVHVVNGENMPTEGPVAAILRW